MNTERSESKKAKTIVIAGIDGAGKETQAEKLREKFASLGMSVVVVSYPMYERTLFGMLLDFILKSKLVSLFLGSFAFANTDPLAASLLYAADRRQSLPYLKKLIAENDVVIFDRYVEANLIHQGGKLENSSERIRFANTIMHLEYDILELPRPDVTIYLRIPYEVSIERARKRAEQRGETPDVVETNLKYVRDSFTTGELLSVSLNWQVVSSVSDSTPNAPYLDLSKEEIHQKVCEKLGIK